MNYQWKLILQFTELPPILYEIRYRPTEVVVTYPTVI